ncbi:hypothetical protein BT93_K0536 [Corymbia citriodora subsp. variegata]|nr:hypothetical protein BT93_K0536 [Corymbia citriodora subsp. variegata]
MFVLVTFVNREIRISVCRVNVSTGEREERMMMTGMHTVADIFCVGCGAIVGWKYETAHEKSQKYKEGKSVLERIKLFGPMEAVTGPIMKHISSGIAMLMTFDCPFELPKCTFCNHQYSCSANVNLISTEDSLFSSCCYLLLNDMIGKQTFDCFILIYIEYSIFSRT